MNGFSSFASAVKSFEPIINNLKSAGLAEYVSSVEISNAHLAVRITCKEPVQVVHTLFDLEAANFDLRYITPQVDKNGNAFAYIYHNGSLLAYVVIDANMQDLMQGIEEYHEAQS